MAYTLDTEPAQRLVRLTLAAESSVAEHLASREDLVAYRDIRTRYLGDCEPASMLTFLPALVWPEMLIELEVVAADLMPRSLAMTCR